MRASCCTRAHLPCKGVAHCTCRRAAPGTAQNGAELLEMQRELRGRCVCRLALLAVIEGRELCRVNADALEVVLVLLEHRLITGTDVLIEAIRHAHGGARLLARRPARGVRGPSMGSSCALLGALLRKPFRAALQSGRPPLDPKKGSMRRGLWSAIRRTSSASRWGSTLAGPHGSFVTSARRMLAFKLCCFGCTCCRDHRITCKDTIGHARSAFLESSTYAM